jgi:hypothetical protein
MVRSRAWRMANCLDRETSVEIDRALKLPSRWVVESGITACWGREGTSPDDGLMHLLTDALEIPRFLLGRRRFFERRS